MTQVQFMGCTYRGGGREALGEKGCRKADDRQERRKVVSPAAWNHCDRKKARVLAVFIGIARIPAVPVIYDAFVRFVFVRFLFADETGACQFSSCVKGRDFLPLVSPTSLHTKQFSFNFFSFLILQLPTKAIVVI